MKIRRKCLPFCTQHGKDIVPFCWDGSILMTKLSWSSWPLTHVKIHRYNIIQNIDYNFTNNFTIFTILFIAITIYATLVLNLSFHLPVTICSSLSSQYLDTNVLLQLFFASFVFFISLKTLDCTFRFDRDVWCVVVMWWMVTGGVGKSSLVLRFIKGTFRESYIPTIEDTYRQVRDFIIIIK